MTKLTQKLVREHLRYCPTTGQFTWRVCSSRAPVGSVAGCVGYKGYRTIGLLNEQVRAHRLAFLYMTGSIPEIVDHIDGDVSNNVWENLRGATASQSIHNQKIPTHNTSGHKNVSWSKRANKWMVQVCFKYKRYHGGFYEELSAAIDAAHTLREKLHGEFANHGGVNG